MRFATIAAMMLALIPACAMGPAPAEAKGCLKGAVVGGVAGHYAGHHGVMGAIGGCIVGHHMANEKAKEQAARRAPRALHPLLLRQPPTDRKARAQALLLSARSDLGSSGQRGRPGASSAIDHPEPQPLHARPGDHRAVVGAKLGRRRDKGQAGLGAELGQRLAQRRSWPRRRLRPPPRAGRRQFAGGSSFSPMRMRSSTTSTTAA